MRKIIIVILIFSIVDTFAQCLVVKKIEIYGVGWNVCFRIPITIKSLKQHSQYHLILNENDNTSIDLYNLFYDYKSCKALLKSQDTITYQRFHPSWRGKTCIACVKLFFCNGRIAKIYFRANGEYYFQRKYYKANKELYYCIFQFFEKDAIMPNEFIEECQKSFEEKYK